MINTINDIVQDPNERSLLDVPNNALGAEIFSIASKADATTIMAKLSNTCTTFHAFFQPELKKRKAEKVRELLVYVLQGNSVKAKEIYTAHPELLFIESTAQDFAAGIGDNLETVHRLIVASPFRAAVGAEHIEMLKDMAKCFNDYIDSKGITGRQLAAEQMALQLPNGFINPPSTYDFSAIANAITTDPIIINANGYIRRGQASEATETALAQFRKDFIPGTITVGKHFNMNHLVNAFAVRSQNLRSWNHYQSSVFWCQVIGYLERLVPARHALIHIGGYYNYYFRNELRESFELWNTDTLSPPTNQKIYYLPLDISTYRLGLSFGVREASGAGMIDSYMSESTGASEFRDHVEQTERDLESLSISFSHCHPTQLLARDPATF